MMNHTILADAQLVLDSSSAAQLAQYREWGVIIAAMLFITAVLYIFLKRENNHDLEMNAMSRDYFDRLTDAVKKNTEAQNEFRRVVQEKFDAIDERVLKIERNASEMNSEIQIHSERLDQHEETLADQESDIKRLSEDLKKSSARVPIYKTADASGTEKENQEKENQEKEKNQSERNDSKRRR